MKRIIKILSIFFIWLSAFSTLFVSADAPYVNYNYSEETGKLIYAPQAYLPERVVYAGELGLSDFKNAADIFYRDGCLYVLDSGNSRVVALNSDFSLKSVFNFSFPDETEENRDISGAKGVFVSADTVYIADTLHARIIAASRENGQVSRLITVQKAEALGQGFVFKPAAVAVDSDGLLYVVGDGTYEGVINMNADGDFLGFFGSNTVSTSVWDLFWRRFSTKKQRKTMLQLIPQDFSGIDIDSSGFLLTTAYTAQNGAMVKRLNPGGTDVIRNRSRIGVAGDPGTIWSGSMAGKSSFSDIAAGSDNIYACLDYKRGKVFCYDNDGYMLYNFGTISDQTGGFSAPAALTYLGDNSRIAVLNSETGGITVFGATDYAEMINTGIHYEMRLEYDTAFGYWNKVIALNSGCDFAHNSLGQIYFNNSEYGKAKSEFRKANNRNMYSKAVKELRSEWIFGNIHIILIITAAVVAAAVFISLRRRFKRRKRS